MGNNQVDRFGRAMELAQCTLHLRGVLVKINVSYELESGNQNRAYITGYEWMLIIINWDSNEERRLAAERGYKVEIRGLIFMLNPNDGRTIRGLLLRPLEPSRYIDGCTVWVRCGFIEYTNIVPQMGRELTKALRIERYGFGYHGNVWWKGWMPPDLEDIYIV
ncbi:hypothetical protein VM1G_11584 [Cytospora mali]|uniref:Uncharacterized protein n=1 Tax=Cytospora mali TaxID=578113 RepID=A0A194VVB5_CYTMA|nr:hypothetical protein VM1G_11584 [Valsa mali]